MQVYLFSSPTLFSLQLFCLKQKFCSKILFYKCRKKKYKPKSYLIRDLGIEVPGLSHIHLLIFLLIELPILI